MELVHETECEVGMVPMVAAGRYLGWLACLDDSLIKYLTRTSGSLDLPCLITQSCLKPPKNMIATLKSNFTCAATENNWAKKSQRESERSPASDFTWLASVSPGLNFSIHFHVTLRSNSPALSRALGQIFARKRERSGISRLISRRAGEKSLRHIRWIICPVPFSDRHYQACKMNRN